MIKNIVLASLLVSTLSFAKEYDYKAEAIKKSIEILNVSYDPTRELYEEYNKNFAKYWQEKTGQKVTIKQSHGGSGKQARGVIDGLKADVVTLALAYDIDAISQKANLFPKDWQKKLEYNSSPYTSTIVFLVRKGNPKGVKDWNDLIKDGVEVITPNPKTSGGARWNYLAAYAYGLKEELGTLEKIDFNSSIYKKADKKAKEYVTKLLKHVPVLDSGARGATNTFVQRKIGDVLLAWENEAFLAINELGKDEFEIVVPSVSILAEPPVTVVEQNAIQKETLNISTEYLKYLYSKAGQTLVAKHYYRPSVPSLVEKKYLEIFPKLELFKIEDVFISWENA
ncbi:sulfate transporter subunit [Aliarcobacter trophiarum LMG 25534]|uniref:Sulfate ABC transporter, sulfate binding protein n=2 Tax=Aliarcobacter trophiarum TaxID=708186 RepID=A0AAD0VN32_9BACT|nr:sulfate ABC transporter substrate-binding protein [Aliarcobacter trophiarum]AXK49774.1 sulfate ABC transporter, sulfate binding protein [Aliarcobacter trophiarum LMG 25534]RXJ92450.1 sulfate transporter subunit [Aliarcobacter trophiarum LMG 25534]